MAGFDFLRSTKTASPHSSVSEAPRRYEGFTDNGVVVSDHRGAKRLEAAREKGGSTMADDPLAIYKPTGAKHVDSARAMGNFSNWVYAAVNAIAAEVSNIQWRLYQIKGKDHEEQDDHPLLELLDGVNESMTGIELKYITSAHLELTGNAYWLMEGVTNDTDQPTALHPLNPGRMRVKVDKSVFPYRLSHYEYTMDGKVYTFHPYQIVHIKYPDPNDPFVGIGVPQAVPTWIDSDNYAMEYNRKFFINGAAIGMYVATQTNVEGQIDRIRKGFDEKYAGVENAHRVPVMPKGVDIKNAGVSNRDMDFANLADNTRDRILAAFRVSKTILGTAESDTNRSTAETADYVFSKRTIKPKMLLLVSYLNEYLVPRYGDDIYLTFIDPVPEDKEARTEEMSTAVGAQPVITVNEARKNFMGLGPVEGGDKLMAPTTMTESGKSNDLEGEDLSPNLAKTAEGRISKTVRVRKGGKTAYSATHRMRSTLAEAMAKALDSLDEKPYSVKSVKDLTHQEYMEHWKRFDARSRRAMEDLKTVFHGINAKQKEEVLKNLPDAVGAKKALGDLFNLEEWIALTIDLATPIIHALGKDEATAALQMIGLAAPDKETQDAVLDALDTGVQKMARSYNQTTVDNLKQVIGAKLTQDGGTSLTELTQAVSDVYAFADDRRASMISKTESFRAANQANLTAWDQSGVVSSIMWYTAEDDKVCELCAPLDGTIVATGATFFEDDYADGDSPPLHPDCRCYIRPEDVSIGDGS